MIWRIHCTGYVGDPEATSTTLDPDGWLRTGDLCYIDEEGFLFVVDRLKELIKYKGYQVINYITSVLVSCPIQPLLEHKD